MQMLYNEDSSTGSLVGKPYLKCLTLIPSGPGARIIIETFNKFDNIITGKINWTRNGPHHIIEFILYVIFSITYSFRNELFLSNF